MSRHRRARRLWEEMDEDPGTGLLNLFDIWIAFAVSLLLAMVSYMHMPELLGQSDITVIKNPGAPDMEVIQKQGQKINHYRATTDQLTGQGVRLGVAYQIGRGTSRG